MAKYHINKHGVPAVCRARLRACPLGGDDVHFDTIEQAQAHIDEYNAMHYGLLGGAPAPTAQAPEEIINESVSYFLNDERFAYINGAGYSFLNAFESSRLTERTICEQVTEAFMMSFSNEVSSPNAEFQIKLLDKYGVSFDDPIEVYDYYHSTQQSRLNGLSRGNAMRAKVFQHTALEAALEYSNYIKEQLSNNPSLDKEFIIVNSIAALREKFASLQGVQSDYFENGEYYYTQFSNELKKYAGDVKERNFWVSTSS